MLHDIVYRIAGDNWRGVPHPFCVELFVAHVVAADLRNRSAGKAAVCIPAFKCIALSGYIVLCRQSRTCAIGIAYHIFSVSNRTTVCFQHYGISHRCPLRRQGSHTCRNICTRNIRIPIAALPAEISIRFPDWTGQAGTFGSREALTVFHNDIYRACGIANFPII